MTDSRASCVVVLACHRWLCVVPSDLATDVSSSSSSSPSPCHDDRRAASRRRSNSRLRAVCLGLAYCLQIVKTRLMVQEKTAGGGPQRYRGLFHGMYTIAKEEGFMQLYRGLLPRVLRVPPGMVRQAGGRGQPTGRLAGEREASGGCWPSKRTERGGDGVVLLCRRSRGP